MNVGATIGALLVVGVGTGVIVHIRLSALEGSLMGQYEDLKSAIAELGVELLQAVARVEAKIKELGDPDPDLSADIANIRSASTSLHALVATPADPGGGGGDTPGGGDGGGGDTPGGGGDTPGGGGDTPGVRRS